MKKEELIAENTRLSGNLRTEQKENERLRKENYDLRDELEDYKQEVQILTNNLNYLAGMLYKEGVEVSGLGKYVRVTITPKEKSDF